MAYVDNFDLNTTAVINRRAYVKDGKGGGSYTTTTLATVKCAFWQGSAVEQFTNDRISNISSFVIACAPISGIRANDTVTIGSNTYKITKPDNVRAFDELMVIGMELVE